MILNEIMSFDHVIRVDEFGQVHDAPDVYPPLLYGDDVYDSQWRLLRGWSRQFGYFGPMMHPSEFIGGALERFILETPGYYVALVQGREWAIATMN